MLVFTIDNNPESMIDTSLEYAALVDSLMASKPKYAPNANPRCVPYPKLRVAAAREFKDGESPILHIPRMLPKLPVFPISPMSPTLATLRYAANCAPEGVKTSAKIDRVLVVANSTIPPLELSYLKDLVDPKLAPAAFGGAKVSGARILSMSKVVVDITVYKVDALCCIGVFDSTSLLGRYCAKI